jgi:hypothetical protein
MTGDISDHRLDAMSYMMSSTTADGANWQFQPYTIPNTIDIIPQPYIGDPIFPLVEPTYIPPYIPIAPIVLEPVDFLLLPRGKAEKRKALQKALDDLDGKITEIPKRPLRRIIL